MYFAIECYLLHFNISVHHFRYGDIVPKRVANKFVGVIVMVTGLIFASLLTATTTDFVFDASYEYHYAKV